MSRTRMHQRYYKYTCQFSLLALPASMMRHGGRTYSAWETAEAGRVTELHAREYEDHQRVGWLVFTNTNMNSDSFSQIQT
jgi:hypothetical protein